MEGPFKLSQYLTVESTVVESAVAAKKKEFDDFWPAWNDHISKVKKFNDVIETNENMIFFTDDEYIEVPLRPCPPSFPAGYGYISVDLTKAMEASPFFWGDTLAANNLGSYGATAVL